MKPQKWSTSLFLVCCATCCLFVQAAYGKSYYVAVNGSNEQGDGTVQKPWATISYAIDQVSDGDVIEVGPGTYTGRVQLDQRFNNGITIRSTTPYTARLRYGSGAALICYTCKGVTVEGFDIAHTSNNNDGLVIQIQSTSVIVSDVTLRNNIIHDSTDNDLLKVNNGARDVLVEGNLFYNQAGSDEHIDINSTIGVTVQDNVFFNTGSQAVTSSFIVIKDSNGNSDGVLGNKDTIVRRNIFLNWQGNTGQSFVRAGEDSTKNFEAENVLVENNLMLGNSSRLMRTAFTVQGSRNIRFQFNTVVGDLPSKSFAARLLAVGQNQPNELIFLRNNIWSDPTGTMGTESFSGVDLFDAPNGNNASVTLDNNLYYNGGATIPVDTSQEVKVSDDANAVFGNPRLPSQSGLVLPTWTGSQFAGGYASIRDVFVDFAERYGRPAANSAVIDQASAIDAPDHDLLGAPRGNSPDIGAIEVGSSPPPPPPPPPAPPPPGRRINLAWLLLLLLD